MSTLALESLKSSVLWEPNQIADNYRGLSEDALERELHTYSQAAPPWSAERCRKEIALYMDRPLRDFSSIASAILLADRLVLLDPILEAARPVKDFYFHPRPQALDRAKIANAVAALKDVVPLIEQGWLSLLPRQDALKPPRVPIIASEANFIELVPEHILRTLAPHANVRSLVVTDDGRRLVMSKPTRCSSLHVDFGDRKMAYGFDYPVVIDPADTSQYEFYRDNALRRAAWMFLQPVAQAIREAETIGTSLVLSSQLQYQVFGGSQAAAAPPSFDLELFSDISPGVLAKVQASDGEAFEVFRAAIRQALRSARGLDNLQEKALFMQDFSADIEEIHLPKLKKTIREKALLLGLYAAGTAFSFAVSGVVGVVPLISLLGEAYKAESEIRNNPFLFLWELDWASRRARKRTRTR